MKTGIVCAAKSEAAALLSCGFFGWRKSGNGFYRSGKTDGILCISGIGREKAAESFSALAQECGKIFILGTCAALVPEIPIFTFCLPNTGVRHEDSANTFMPDRKLSAELADILSSLKINFAPNLKLVETEKVITSKEQAEDLHCRANALIADMESATFLRQAEAHHVPTAILKVVSDNPAAGLSPFDAKTNSSVNRWAENTAKISSDFLAIAKLLLS
ncbi:MAG: hypothetical protein J1G30_01445 [Spirochaetales bacterium]|nr:hypothetical protein [Spirochaetales bacterium]